MLHENCTDLFGYFRNEVKKQVTLLSNASSPIPEDVLDKIVVLPPTEKGHGDIYTNAALILGQYQKKSPMEIAKTLTSVFREIPGIEDISTVAPGFINFRCDVKVWHNVVRTVVELAGEYGRINLGNSEKVNIEFVSANPTGPLHVGHARGAVYGDVLATLLKWVGYDVTKEYYINDAGNQINLLTESVLLRYTEILKNEPITHALPYPGEYLKQVAHALISKYGDGLSSNHSKLIRDFTVDYILNLIKEDLELLGVQHDVFTSELDLHSKNTIEKCLDYLQNKNLLYQGTLDC